jgi:choline dehydrogenase-like flavoprotein
MINDFREMADEAIIEADLCIIGAGAAGISMAKYLMGSRLQVCLVESGGFEFDVGTQSLYKGKNIGRRYFPLDATRLRYFGGTTNHWGGWCAPLSDIDFKQRDWVPYSGWPITRQDLEQYYIQAQKLCEVGPYRYEHEDWETDEFKLLDVLPEKIANKLWQLSPTQTKFGKVYRAELEKASNIQVLLHANVLEILSNKSAQAVEGVKIASLDTNKTATVRAKVVVLACGGLENPRILLVSNRVQSAGLGNQNDMVGRFFMEHPHAMETATLVTLKHSLPLAYYNGSTVREGTHLQPALGISEPAQQKHQILNIAALTHSNSSIVQSEGYRAFRKISKALKSNKFPNNFSDHIINVITDLDDVASGLYYRLRGISKPLPRNTHITFRSMSEQVPNPDSRVVLNTEKDALGLPRLKLDWRLTELDKRSIRVIHQLVGEEFGRMGLGRLKISEWLLAQDDSWHDHVVGGFHHMGTTRMSEDPKQGVVDKNCRVHGLANLYIAGSSVFATSGYCNPTLTLVALAVRLAAHLEKQVLS